MTTLDSEANFIHSDFYFLRHGEANFPPNPDPHDEPDVSLTEIGIEQAKSIRSLIKKLPIQSICVSPMKRAIETSSIVAQDLSSPARILEELRECSGAIWDNMMQLEENPHLNCKYVNQFIERTISGVRKALSQPGPVLIIAHGGIHWAICHYLNIKYHDKKVRHCIPVHFYPKDSTQWGAKYLCDEHYTNGLLYR